MNANTVNRLWLKTRPSLLTSALFAAIILLPLSVAGTECEVLGEQVVFVDVMGLPVDVGSIDVIAYRQVDDKVIVYERSAAAAAALVTDLAADGESDPALLDAKTWLLARAGACRMTAGSCYGVCAGKQTCKRVKKPGKDICECMLRGS